MGGTKGSEVSDGSQTCPDGRGPSGFVRTAAALREHTYARTWRAPVRALKGAYSESITVADVARSCDLGKLSDRSATTLPASSGSMGAACRVGGVARRACERVGREEGWGRCSHVAR